MIEKAGTAEYDAYFIPTDITNYDWSKADIAEDAYEVLANGSVRIKVKITVKADKQIPEYKVPTDLKGIEQGGGAKHRKQSAQCNDDDHCLRQKQGGVVGAAF